MLHYQTKGNGNCKIIFIHGNSQSLGIWDDITGINSLADNYTLITADLPGHGKSFRSSSPSKDYSIPGMSLHLKEFIKQHSITPYIIVAHSLGTNLVGEIAHLLLNCKGIFLTGVCIIGESIQLSDILQPNPNLAPYFTAYPTDDAIDKLMEDAAFHLSAAGKEKNKLIFKKTDASFREKWLASVSKQEWTDEIKNFTTAGLPVAVVNGSEDKIANIHYLEKSSLNKWKDKIISVPEAGHLLEQDQPQALASFISEFAKECFI